MAIKLPTIFFKLKQKSLFYIGKLDEAFTEIYQYCMSIPYSALNNLEPTEALMFLRDRFMCDDDDKIWVTAYAASKKCHEEFNRQTIRDYASKYKYIRFQNKSIIGKEDEIEIWLPDVLFFALVMNSFKKLLKDGKIIKKETIREGQVMYKYAPLSDEKSQKAAIIHNGGIFLEIFTNFAKSFSPETINIANDSYNEIKAKNDKIKALVANSS